MIQAADLTLVVTAYKIAEYIGACLESLEPANLEGCTVLIVDDGSTDGSGQIAKQWCAAGSNRLYLYQENAGVSSARNSALDRVDTPFISFVDGDDVIPPGGISALLAAGSPASDLVIGNRLRFYDDGRPPRPQMLFEDSPDRPVQTVRHAHKRLAIHGKLFRTAFLRERAICFPERMMWEDLVFSYRVNAYAGLVATTAAIVYHYRQRLGENLSLMAGILTPYQIDSRFKQLEICLEIMATPEWRARFRKISFARDIAPHLMVHVRGIRHTPDSALARAAFGRLRTGMLHYDAWIRRSAKPPLRDDFLAVLDGRLDLLRPADEENLASQPEPEPATPQRATGIDRSPVASLHDQAGSPSLRTRMRAAWRAFVDPVGRVTREH